MDYTKDMGLAALRYVGKPVIVHSYAHQRFMGILALCTYDFLVLTNCLAMSELDSGSQWQDQITMGNLEDGITTGAEEVLIRLHNVLSISCNADHIPPLDFSVEQNQELTIGSSERFSIEIGSGLIPFLQNKTKRPIVTRIKKLRSDVKEELGFEVPPIRIHEDMKLEPSGYQFLLDGTIVASGKIYPGQFLAISTTAEPIELTGELTLEPAFGLPAIWLDDRTECQRAEATGFTVVDAETVLVTHLGRVIKDHSSDLLTYDSVCESLEALKGECPSLVKDNFESVASRTVLLQVLQNLLREHVWIGCFQKVVETIAVQRIQGVEPSHLTEVVRGHIGVHILRNFVDSDNRVTTITFSPKLEHEFVQALPEFNAAYFREIVDVLKETIDQQEVKNEPAVIMVSSKRKEFFECIRRSIPKATVVLPQEFPVHFTMKLVKSISQSDINERLANNNHAPEMND